MPETINNINDLFGEFNGSSNKKIGEYGQESFGFAGSVLNKVQETFYNKNNRAQADATTVPKGMAEQIPRSIFNQYALFNYRGLHGGLLGSEPYNDYFDSSNNTLMGGEFAHNISIPKIIEYYSEVYPKIKYKAQDFLYCKYYKRIPVNHIITLRRFPTPVEDNIFDLTASQDVEDPKTDPTSKQKSTNNAPSKKITVTESATQIAGVTAVTYLGEIAGNKLEDILNFSYGLNWKTLESSMQEIDASQTDGGYTSQPFYSKMGNVGKSITDALAGVSAGTKFRKQNAPGGDLLSQTYANFVLGPVNVVDETVIRDTGLKFTNDIKLNFEYELKSLNYVNPKVAMIDIISNMLTMTTNNAQFFGGGHRYYGGQGFVKKQFGDIRLLRSGNFSGYMGSVVGDVEKGFKGLFGNKSGGFDLESIKNGLLTGGKTLLGNMLGSFLGDNVGAIPGTQATRTFISAEPTGDWHLTVGNPLNPIVIMGNMYCDNATMTLGSGLGYDDFPMEVKFEIDLKHGKPRDKGDIENMFNAGRGRIYASAAEFGDILNLAGKDIATYGSVRAGKINYQQSQSAPSGNDIQNNNINNLKSTKNESAGTSMFTSDDSAYVSNLVSMIIDS